MSSKFATGDCYCSPLKFARAGRHLCGLRGAWHNRPNCKRCDRRNRPIPHTFPRRASVGQSFGFASGLPPGPELVFLSMNHLKGLVISAIRAMTSHFPQLWRAWCRGARLSLYVARQSPVSMFPGSATSVSFQIAVTWREVRRGVPRSPNGHLVHLRVARKLQIRRRQVEFDRLFDVLLCLFLRVAGRRTARQFPGRPRRTLENLHRTQAQRGTSCPHYMRRIALRFQLPVQSASRTCAGAAKLPRFSAELLRLALMLPPVDMLQTEWRSSPG